MIAPARGRQPRDSDAKNNHTKGIDFIRENDYPAIRIVNSQCCGKIFSKFVWSCQFPCLASAFPGGEKEAVFFAGQL